MTEPELIATAAEAASSKTYLPSPIARPGASVTQTVRWLGQFVLNVFWSLAGGHIIRWDYITLYFLVTQNNGVRPTWNTLLNGVLGARLWTVLRHFMRAGFEGQFTAATLWVLVANPFTVLREPRRAHGPGKVMRAIFAPSWLLSTLERLGVPTPRTYRKRRRVSWLQWLGMLPALIISALPGYALGIGLYFLVTFIGREAGLHPHVDYSHYAAFAKQDASVAANWQYALAGVLGTLFYSRLVFRVYAMELLRALSTQLAALHQRAVIRGQSKRARMLVPRWPLPAGFRAAFKVACEREQRISKFALVMLIAAFAYIVLAAPAGYLIITEVATGHWHIRYF